MRYPTVAEAVRGVRGVYVSDDRGYVTLGFRGFSRPGDYGNRTLVLLNGQPMNDDWLWSSYVGYDFRTDLEDVERIEVVRGPGSVLYGTGAFSGVVNVVTRGPDEPSGAEVGVSAGGDGVARARARVQERFGDHGGVWTSLAVGHGEGTDYFFPEYASQGPPQVAGNARGLDGFDVVTWGGQARWDFIKLQWSLNSHRKTLPTGQFDTILGDGDTRQTDTRAMVEAKAEPNLGAAGRVDDARVRELLRLPRPLRALPGGGRPRVPHVRRAVGGRRAAPRLQAGRVAPLHGRGRGAAALQRAHLRHERHAGRSTTTTRTASRSSPRTLVGDYVPSRVLKVELGGRVDSYVVLGSLRSARSPRASRSSSSPPRSTSVKLLGGGAFRAPSIYELYYASGPQLANPGLQPEHMVSAEIEYSHRFTQTITGLLSVYDNVITDLIAQRSTGTTLADGTQPFQYQNTNAPVETLGAEAEVRREWKDGWMVAASYSLQRSKYVASTALGDLVAQKQNTAFREVPNAPEHIASMTGAVPILARMLVASSRLTFNSGRWDRYDQPVDPVSGVPNPQQSHTEPVVLWDIVLSGTEQRWGLSYAFGVYNAFDWRWSVPVSPEFLQTTIPQDGRTFLATVSKTF